MLKILTIHLSLSMLFQESLFDGNKENLFNINQNDHKITIERVEIVSVNKNLVNYLTGVTFKYNRTCTAFNITFNYKINLRYDMEIIVQAYKFASNEYRQFPVRFEFNFCEALNKNTFGVARFKKYGNFSGCPIAKGRDYYVYNFTPDPSHFPPLMPNGRYMTEFQGLYRSNEMWVARAYSEVTRPIV